jgi:glycosyltransferase (activator-dependent family)
MRVLFTSFAAKSHMHAQVPIAWALQTAGHEVVLASQPDLADDITKTGLTPVCVGDPLLLDQQMQETQEGIGEDTDQGESQAEAGLDMSEIRPEKLTWDYTLGVFTAMTSVVFQNCCDDKMTDDLVAFAKHWKPDLVVWDTMTFGGAVAAKACGAAHARLLFGIDLFGRMRQTFRGLLDARDPALRDDPIAEWMSWTAERHGLEFTEDMLVGQWTIDPVPPSMRFDVDLTYLPFRYVPYNGQAKIPDWLHEPAERTRVCLTLGVAHREILSGDRASIGELLDAVSDLDVEVVATLNEKQLEAIPKLPDNVRAVDFVPLNALLPSCSAIIHHGGSGTFQTALSHGVPQIIVPDLIWDTVHKAYALERAGAGRYVRDTDHFTAAELRGHLGDILSDPSFRQNAEKVRAEMRGLPTPAGVVPILQSLTAEHRALVP